MGDTSKTKKRNTQYALRLTCHVRRIQPQRHRPVVDQLDVHHGAEAAGRHGQTLVAQLGDEVLDQRLGNLGPGGLEEVGAPAFRARRRRG